MSESVAVDVLKTVRVAEEGNLYGREIVQGTRDSVPLDLLDGLVAEGYVAAAGPLAAGLDQQPVAADDLAAVEIPEDWRELLWSDLKSLGAKLGDGRSKEGALAAIEAELARRQVASGPAR